MLGTSQSSAIPLPSWIRTSASDPAVTHPSPRARVFSAEEPDRKCGTSSLALPDSLYTNVSDSVETPVHYISIKVGGPLMHPFHRH